MSAAVFLTCLNINLVVLCTANMSHHHHDHQQARLRRRPEPGLHPDHPGSAQDGIDGESVQAKVAIM